MTKWIPNQPNNITFVMVDANGTEVIGLGTGFVLQLRKPGGVFANSAGIKAEIGSGWYEYTSTADEADTIGPIAIKITHASTLQQNLEYEVGQRTAGAIEFTYTLTRSDNADPIPGATVRFCSDSDGFNNVFVGVTDALGVVRDGNGDKPYLFPGTYYLFRYAAGYRFANPDTEAVSA